MGISSFFYNLDIRRLLVDPQSGVPIKDGRDLLLALWNRTGAGTGIVAKVSAPLTATGSTIDDALALATDWNWVATVAVGTGVQILPLKPGNDIEVWNAGAHNLNVYPPSAAIQIDALGNGAPFILAPGKLRTFQCWTLNQFLSFGS